MDDKLSDKAEFETPQEAGSGYEGLVRLWLSAIDLASKEEEGWRKEAAKTLDIYRNGDSRETGNVDRQHTFNILFSNVETICPAVYNSTPIPDVRRRFNDPDPVAKEGAQVIERCLSYSLDAYDFDAVMENAIQDDELVGRGVTRVRYQPYVTQEPTGEQLTWEEAICEHVPWANFRRGPGRNWSDVPWIAFELFLTRQQLLELSPTLGGSVALDAEVGETAKDKDAAAPPPEVFKRARVWEIWDKEKREVLFIACGLKDKPLRVEPDPLGLKDFWPVPRPLYAVKSSDSMVPVPPYRMYRDQAEELSRVTRRITALVACLKWRGVRDASISEFSAVADADDGELVAMEDAQQLYSQAGGLEKAIWLMPIERLIVVLKELYVQREQIKQVIFEITGIADIMRGQTEASETLGAQQIKAQWGSLRVQRRQKEAARYARDLLRIKAEIIASKFEPQTLFMMSGVKLPSMAEKQQAMMAMQQAQAAQQPPPPEVEQALSKPTAEEVVEFLRSDIQRIYRIDVESDSTIRADLTRAQENMSNFLQGTAQFIGAVGPAVQSGQMPADAAAEIYTAFARTFKLGKQAEDALDRLAEGAREQAKQPKEPSPEEIKAKGDQEKMAAEMQMMQAKFQMEMQAKQADLEIRRQTAEIDMAIKAQEFELKKAELAMKAEELSLKERAMHLDAEVKERNAVLGMQASEHKHALGMEMMDAKAKQAMTKEPAE